MDVEKQLRRLQVEIHCLAVVMVALLIWVAGTYGLAWLGESSTKVHLERQGNTVYFRSSSDRPFVITHLTVDGREAQNGHDKRLAALPIPLACIDSNNVAIQDITKLEWKDVNGEPASVPDENVQLSALMLRPEHVGPRLR